MFSALKFVAATIIVALFGGFLLAATLTAPLEDRVAPAAPTDAESETFPLGTFVSNETGRVVLEFLEGGTGHYFSSTAPEKNSSFLYASDGDVYTTEGLIVGSDRYNVPTYRWTFDGEQLAFELLGEDSDPARVWLHTENTFRVIEDPVIVLTAMYDYDADDRVHGIRVFVPAAEAPAEALKDRLAIRGHVATGPISQGQPITPDLVRLPD